MVSSVFSFVERPFVLFRSISRPQLFQACFLLVNIDAWSSPEDGVRSLDFHQIALGNDFFFGNGETVCTGLFHPLQAVLKVDENFTQKMVDVQKIRFEAKEMGGSYQFFGVKRALLKFARHTTWTWNLNFLLNCLATELSLEIVASWPAE